MCICIYMYVYIYTNQEVSYIKNDMKNVCPSGYVARDYG